MATKSKKLILAKRSKSRSLTCVSFKRALYLEHACKIEVSISYSSKVIVQVDNRQTNRQDEYASDHLIREHKKYFYWSVLQDLSETEFARSLFPDFGAGWMLKMIWDLGGAHSMFPRRAKFGLQHVRLSIVWWYREVVWEGQQLYNKKWQHVYSTWTPFMAFSFLMCQFLKNETECNLKSRLWTKLYGCHGWELFWIIYLWISFLTTCKHRPSSQDTCLKCGHITLW